MNKTDILKMIDSIGQKIVWQSEDRIEIESTTWGDNIHFEFDDNENLISIYT